MTTQNTIPTSLSGGTNIGAGFPSSRPWKEMVRSLDLPSGFGNTIERIKTNLVYFQTNYMIILMLIVISSFLYHPAMFYISLSLLGDAFLVFHRSPRKIVIVLMIVSVIFLVLINELIVNEPAAWNIKWTLLIEAVVVATHATFRKTDDLSQLDKKSTLATGLPSAYPWKEMVRSLNLPSGFRNTIERVKMNLAYFQMNYMLILSQILFIGYFFTPISLRGQWALFTAFLMFLYSLRNKSLVVFHRLIDDRTVVFASSIVTVILVMLFDNAAVWNVESTLLIEAVVVAAHSLVSRTDDLSLDDLCVDEELQVTTGLLTSS